MQIQIPLLTLWGCTCTSHLNKDFPCFSDEQEQKQNKNNKNEIKKTRTLQINKYCICYIVCRPESRETLPLQLPLYSLSLSLTLNIKTHDLSPNLSSPCIYFSCKQGFGSGSGSVSGWIRINLSCWIRIRIQIADPDPGGQKWPQKKKKVQNFHLLKCWMFSFEGWWLYL